MELRRIKNLSFNNSIENFKIRSFFLHKEIEVKVYLLYYDEFSLVDYHHVLNYEEKQRIESFKSTKRKREFLAVRLLKNELFGDNEICYSEIGAPFIANGGFISISHAEKVVGIAVSKSPIGLDLEPINEKVHRVKHKFLSGSEKQVFNINSTEELIKIWSAKEALYKLSGEKGLIFSDNLILLNQRENHIYAKIKTEKQNKNVTLQVEVIDDFVMSVNVSPLQDAKENE